MKTKEYLDKYNLHKGWNTKIQNEFISDMTSEFEAQLMLNKAEDNIRGFDNALRCIRMKWDSISNKIPYGIPDKLWNYFFATVIAPLREQMCPKEMQRRREIREEKQRRYEERKKWERDFVEEMYQAYMNSWKNYYKNLLAHIVLASMPIDSFAYLGLAVDATVDDIQKRFRELALKAHPDRGGSQEKFIELTNHRNKCLKWASTRNNK